MLQDGLSYQFAEERKGAAYLAVLVKDRWRSKTRPSQGGLARRGSGWHYLPEDQDAFNPDIGVLKSTQTLSGAILASYAITVF
jgi:hypothetical protein